jgi:hypothetical protein
MRDLSVCLARGQEAEDVPFSAREPGLVKYLLTRGQPRVERRVRLYIYDVKCVLQYGSQFRYLSHLPRESPVEAENKHKRIQDPSAHRLPDAWQHSRQCVLLIKPE